MGNTDLTSIYVACKSLRQARIVRFVEGSSRKMELAPEAPQALFDGRGSRLTSLLNLKYFGKRNTKASMAGRPKVRGRRFVTDW